MLARVFSCALVGLEGVIVEVEVDYSNGLPAVIIVGLPDAAVQESRERVQTAVKNASLHFPRHRIVVNLSSASIRKEGPAYDLPIAHASSSSPVSFCMKLSKTPSLLVSSRSMVLSDTHAEFYRWRQRPEPKDTSGCSSPNPTRPKPP